MKRSGPQAKKGIVALVKQAGREIEVDPRARERLWEAARREIALARAGRGLGMFSRFLPVAAGILLLASAAVTVWMHEVNRASSPAAPDSPWAMWGNRPSGNFSAGKQTLSPPLETLWRYASEGLHSGKPSQSPVTSGALVFTTKEVGRTDHVVALDAASGEERWVSDVETQGFLATDETRVYAMQKRIGGNAAVVALDARDGSVEWTSVLSARGHDFWHPVVVGTTLCVGAGGDLNALDTTTGSVLWQWTGPEAGASCCRPVACGCSKTLYVATDDQRLHAVDPATGAAKWTVDLGTTDASHAHTLLALGKDRVYVMQASGDIDTGPARLLCRNAADGSPVWETGTARALYLAVSGDTLYTKAMDLAAFDTRDGAPLWRRSHGTCAPITCAGDQVYVIDGIGGFKAELLAIAARTGADLWRTPVGKSCVGLVLTGRTGFLAGLDGTLRAVRLGGILPGRTDA